MPSRFHSIKSSVEHAPTPPFNQSGAASPSFSGPWGASCSPYQRCVGVGRPPSLPYHAVWYLASLSNCVWRWGASASSVVAGKAP